MNPEAVTRYRSLVVGTQFDEGTLIVEELHAQGGAPSRSLVLERRANDWQFAVLDAQGNPQPFDDAACRGCHAGALAAPVFGPARELPGESKR